jgi:hypothetical protein
MKRIIAKTLLFILNKWDLSMEDLNLFGKIVLYIPIRINNVLTQLFYLSMFPVVCFYIWSREQIDPFLLMFNLYLFNKN